MKNPSSYNQPSMQKLKEIVTPYTQSSTRRSIWQIVNTIVPYLLLWGLMIYSLQVGYWLTLILAIFVGGFMIRLFIQLHDCAHGSFFASKKANNIWGTITGILTFTAFHHWQHEHAVHHASAGDLDRRGTGDVMTLTITEWQDLPFLKKIGYALYRHPIVLFVFGPFYVFWISHRFASEEASDRARHSVRLTNLMLAIIVGGLSWLIGFQTFLMLIIPVMWVAGAGGIWMFYVQHQFEDVYWEHHDNWSYIAAALDGSSYYKLPKILQWFSGNIGIHHIHHLNPRVPNYNLQACLDSSEIFDIKPITLWTSLKSLKFRLYDDVNQRLVSFREAREILAQTNMTVDSAKEEG